MYEEQNLNATEHVESEGCSACAGEASEKPETLEKLYPGVDIQLDCVECGKSFVFTKNEQEFYRDKGFRNRPKRCPDCRKKKDGDRRSDRQMYEAVCADCGGDALVPFEPREGRPVRCSACFEKYRNSSN